VLVLASDDDDRDVSVLAAAEVGLGSGTVVDEVCGAPVVIVAVVVFGVVPAESVGLGRYQR
jgi:hypothetical protein